MRKSCNRCNQLLPISMFVKNASNKDGYRNECKDCAQVIKQERRNREKPFRRAVISYMKDTGCCVCEEKDHAVLQLHHWPVPFSELGRKRQPIAEPSRGLDEFLDNLVDCVVICANCHLRDHAGTVRVTNPRKFTAVELEFAYREAGGPQYRRRKG